MITKTITIEDLVEQYPVSIKYLSENGIRCIRCGEPIWGTLEEAAMEKGYSEAELKQFVESINQLILTKKG
ncbi:MAG: DUF1858 domain-containing protein [Bacteroidales bacterium]|nr:DUF1858 domain-containing protein [Bacteroidales bacterium]